MLRDRRDEEDVMVVSGGLSGNPGAASPLLVRRRSLLLAGAALVLIRLPSRLAAEIPSRLPVGKPLAWPRYPLIVPDPASSREARLKNKPVRRGHALPDFDDPAAWTVSRPASIGRAAARRAGSSAGVRLDTPMIDPNLMPKPGTFIGHAVSYVKDGTGAVFWRQRFSSPQDWSEFNRISFWVRPQETGLSSYRLSAALISRGAPFEASDPLPLHFLPGLKPGEWNRVVWEFDELPREAVVEFALFQALVGPLGKDAVYDVAEFALERVDPEQGAGWGIAPGRLAFNHIGYRPDHSKVAYAPVGGKSFEVLDAASGRLVAKLPVQTNAHATGNFATLDFSTVVRPGSYRLRYGAALGGAFPIGDATTTDIVDRILNFFYADRCGCPVAGIHGICHDKLIGEHAGERRPINGGWHDAGNLCQGAYRTTFCTGALLSLYESRQNVGHGPQQARLLEEAIWGLDWLLRTRFGKGYRIVDGPFTQVEEGARNLGTHVIQAQNAVFESFMFVAVAMQAARVLGTADPARAAVARAAAYEDYMDAAERYKGAAPPQAGSNMPAPHQIAAYGALAALALFMETKDERLAADAARFARAMLAHQERRHDNKLGISGFYNVDTKGERHVLDHHTSFADAPAAALAGLLEAFPDHPDSALWYASATLESECFFMRGAAIAAPFNHLPNGIWQPADVEAYVGEATAGLGMARMLGSADLTPVSNPANIRKDVEKQLEASLKIGKDSWLRTFPIPRDRVFHGATNIQLAQANAVSTFARLRRNSRLDRLARQQFDWVFGTNPFAASLMAGTGYDYSSQMVMWADDVVGAMPVGMDYRGDKPFWPQTCHMTSREMWVVPAGKLALLVAQLEAPARIRGTSAAVTALVCQMTGRRYHVGTGRYRLDLPAGVYRLEGASGGSRSLPLLPGEVRRLDLDPDKFLEATLEVRDHQIVGRIQGRGSHAITLCGHNVEITGADRTVDLAGGGTTLRWRFSVLDPSRAWVTWLMGAPGHGIIADLVSPVLRC